jgi:hypothetical protein
MQQSPFELEFLLPAIESISPKAEFLYIFRNFTKQAAQGDETNVARNAIKSSVYNGIWRTSESSRILLNSGAF